MSTSDIKPGNLVRRRRQGGRKSIVANLNHGHEIGLVIKEQKEAGTIPQYAVSFPSTQPKLLWFSSYELMKVTSEDCQSV